MPFEAKIIRHSTSPSGMAIISAELFDPRIIHAEAKTHRRQVIDGEVVEFIEDLAVMNDPNLARNASSSRAMPVVKLIQDALDNPAVPIHWGANQAGMQAAEELTGAGLLIVQEAWFNARDAAVAQATVMANHGASKQLVNRILEPYTHIRVLATGTADAWSNFMALRRHPDADPTIRHLAELLFQAIQVSTPTLLKPGQWHLPYITEEDYDQLSTAPDETLDTDPSIAVLLMVSAARCARLSYRLHDNTWSTVEKDIDLYQRLVGGDVKHASPTEHQATPDIGCGRGWLQPKLHGPFTGWVQHRTLLIPGENITSYPGVN